MTKQKMLLPLTCEQHTHEGYGTSKDVPCPWCETERLEKALAAAQFLLHNPQVETSIAVEPTTLLERAQALLRQAKQVWPNLSEHDEAEIDAVLRGSPEPGVNCSGCGKPWTGAMIGNVPNVAVCALCGTTWRTENRTAEPE